MAVTLQDLRDIFYDILREDESDSSSYPITLADLMINTAQLNICNGRVVNPLNNTEVRKGELPFLFAEAYYSNVPNTNLTADATTGGATLDVADTTNFPATGQVFIAGNVVTYTGKNATQFTGCTGILFDFKSGMSVSILFSLPTDYSTPINLVYGNKQQLEFKLYDDLYEDLNSYKGNPYGRIRGESMYGDKYRINPFWTIKDRLYILVYNLTDLEGMIKLRYQKLPTELLLVTDETDIDNDIYAKSTIPYLAVAELLYNRGEEGRAAELFNFGLGKVREMYDYYNKSVYQKLNGVQYKMGKSRLNI